MPHATATGHVPRFVKLFTCQDHATVPSAEDWCGGNCGADGYPTVIEQVVCGRVSTLSVTSEPRCAVSGAFTNVTKVAAGVRVAGVGVGVGKAVGAIVCAVDVGAGAAACRPGPGGCP